MSEQLVDPPSGWCRTCDGYTLPWCGHGRTQPPGPCSAIVKVPLVTDDDEGEKPRAFPCLKRLDHDGAHLAHVEWLDGEDGA